MIRALLLLLPLCLATAADDFAELLQRAKANKRLLVSTYLRLDADAEARFAPVFDQFQKDLEALNQRAIQLLQTYGNELDAETLTDDRAIAFVTKSIDIDADELALRRKYIPIVAKVLPGQTAMRYLQLEGKLRAAVRYQAASTVPLVPGN